VASVDQKASAVPYAVDPVLSDRIPTERYFDPDFYRLEVERLWPRVWQMACRLEEIPQQHDFVEYEFLDQSVVVLRTEDMGVRAFENACRHRGVRFVQGRGTCEHGFTCPFHGWCYGPDGTNAGVPRRKTFAEHNLQPGDIDLTPVGAKCSAAARGSTSTTTPRRFASASSPRQPSWTRGGSSRCGRSGGTRLVSL